MNNPRVIILIFAIFLVGTTCFFYYNKQPQKQAPISQSPQSTSTPPSSTPTSPDQVNPQTVILAQEVAAETEGWTTYTNPELGFSIKYPQDTVKISLSNDNAVVFTYTKYDTATNSYGLANLQVLARGVEGQSAFEGVMNEAVIVDGEKVVQQYETVQINNAFGLKTLIGYGPDNYYLTDEAARGVPVCLFVGRDVDTEDIETFRVMLKTFRFER